MREILEGIFTWPWFSQRNGYDFNGYLVRQDGGSLCIDPVEMPPEVLDEIARSGVKRIVLTNRNHFRASTKVKERTGAPIAVHPADAAFVKQKGTPVDEELRVGESVGPFAVVAAPGKSPGEVALHWADRGILLVGDACVGKPPGECALLPDAVIDDKPQLVSSLRELAVLDFDALLLADGAPILEGGRAALRRLLERLPR
ncbi:MAG TPA: MBL fold metallo-hydrolase [Myxococcales bacterium]|nr:MBL fold metallo-hydrolase [Myxococcales bacterium]